jgi:hypothetical protein
MLFLIRKGIYWLLIDLPDAPEKKVTKSKLKDGGDATKTWEMFNSKSGALFVSNSGIYYALIY